MTYDETTCPNCGVEGGIIDDRRSLDRKLYRHCGNDNCRVRIFTTDKEWFQ